MQFSVKKPRQASLELLRAGDHLSLSVQHSFQRLCCRYRRTRQDSIAVIDARRYECYGRYGELNQLDVRTEACFKSFQFLLQIGLYLVHIFDIPLSDCSLSFFG